MSSLPAVALDELLETRVGAQRLEIRAGINGCEVAVPGVECFLQRVQSFLYVAFLTLGRVPPGGIDLNPAFRVGLTGTYHVNADCTGSAEFDFPPPPGVSSGQVIKLMFVLGDHGREIHAVVASLVPAGQDKPIPVLIYEDGKKVGVLRDPD